MGVMWDKAARDIFWQLILNVRETDISHVCDTVIKQMHFTEPPHLPHLQALVGGSVSYKYVTDI